MKRLGFLLLFAFTVALGCKKENDPDNVNLKIDKLIVLDDYKGIIQDIYVSGSKTKLYLYGYPKSHILTLDANDSIIDDFETDRLFSVMFLENGNWIRYGNSGIEVFDSTNQLIISKVINVHTVYEEDVAKTKSGFAVFQRFVKNNTNNVEFQFSYFTNDGDSLTTKIFDYPNDKMSWFIDLIANDKGLLTLGTYGHSGIEHGYKMIYLNEFADTLWSRKIQGPSPAHYLSAVGKQNGFHLAYFNKIGSDWKIETLDSTGQTSKSNVFTLSSAQTFKLFPYQSDYIGLMSFSGPISNSKMKLLDGNANIKQTLSDDLLLTTAVAFFNTPTHLIVGGSRYSLFDVPAFVRVKK
jgi:hypothetical protein